MKRGERVGVGLMIGVFSALMALTVYLEMGHQRNAADRQITADTPTQRMLAMLPKGFLPTQLPEPESKGAKVLSLYCVQCHELPVPSMHTVQEWEQVLARMRAHMDGRSGGMLMRILVPGEREEAALASYLAQYALRAVSPETLPEATSPAAMAYARVCSGCHAIPEPALHKPSEWTLTVLRMKRYMHDGAFPVPDEQTMGLVYRYLASHGVARG